MLNLLEDGNCIMSLVIAKCSGLYYIINPKSVKLRGHNVFHIAIMVMIAYMAVILSMCPFGLYHWSNDVIQFIIQSTIFITIPFGWFKAFTVVRHSDNIRQCLDVTRFDFLSSAITDPHSARFFQMSRNILLKFTGFLALSCYFVFFLWTLLPFFVVGKPVEIKNRDESISSYHLGLYNMYFFVSSETYNEWHLVFHLFEWIFGLCFTIFMILFDTFMITSCIAITYQMKCIAAAYKRLGHNLCTTPKVYFNGAIESDSTNNEYLKDLKLIIKNHQKVLGKMNDFYKIVRPVILPQLIIASIIIIIVSFIMAWIYFNGMLVTSIQSIKICSFPIFFFQIYYTCLIFGNINNQKNVMNLALYSSNWTHMDIQFKKSLLLAMKMHDANKLNIKLTAELIIDLELFTSVINLCFSIFSVLVNSQLKINDNLKKRKIFSLNM